MCYIDWRIQSQIHCVQSLTQFWKQILIFFKSWNFIKLFKINLKRFELQFIILCTTINKLSFLFFHFKQNRVVSVDKVLQLFFQTNLIQSFFFQWQFFTLIKVDFADNFGIFFCFFFIRKWQQCFPLWKLCNLYIWHNEFIVRFAMQFDLNKIPIKTAIFGIFWNCYWNIFFCLFEKTIRLKSLSNLFQDTNKFFVIRDVWQVEIQLFFGLLQIQKCNRQNHVCNRKHKLCSRIFAQIFENVLYLFFVSIMQFVFICLEMLKQNCQIALFMPSINIKNFFVIFLVVTFLCQHKIEINKSLYFVAVETF